MRCSLRLRKTAWGQSTYFQLSILPRILSNHWNFNRQLPIWPRAWINDFRSFIVRTLRSLPTKPQILLKAKLTSWPSQSLSSTQDRFYHEDKIWLINLCPVSSTFQLFSSRSVSALRRWLLPRWGLSLRKLIQTSQIFVKTIILLNRFACKNFLVI